MQAYGMAETAYGVVIDILQQQNISSSGGRKDRTAGG